MLEEIVKMDKLDESELHTFDLVMKALEQSLAQRKRTEGGFQMTESGLRIPSDLMQIVEQRQALWVEYDQSVSNKGKLDDLGSRLPKVEVDEFIEQPLTTSAVPPDELRMALNLMEVELKKIGGIKKEIEQCEFGIQEEEARLRRNKIIAVVVVILVLLAIGYFILVGVGLV